jgi:hypothetical protein
MTAEQRIEELRTVLEHARAVVAKWAEFRFGPLIDPDAAPLLDEIDDVLGGTQ